MSRLCKASRPDVFVIAQTDPNGHNNIQGTFQECLGEHSKMIPSYSVAAKDQILGKDPNWR